MHQYYNLHNCANNDMYYIHCNDMLQLAKDI